MTVKQYLTSELFLNRTRFITVLVTIVAASLKENIISIMLTQHITNKQFNDNYYYDLYFQSLSMSQNQFFHMWFVAHCKAAFGRHTLN